MSDKKRSIGVMLGIIVLASVLCGVGIYTQSLKESKLENKINEKMVQLETMKETHDAEQISFNDLRNKATTKELGISSDIIDEDTTVLRKMLKSAYSWQSNKDYDKARDDLLKTVDEKSSFMTKVFVDRNVYGDGGIDLDSDGTKCFCDALDIYPAYIDGVNIVYYARVDYISYRNDDISKKDHLTVDREILKVTMNPEHQPINIEAEQCDSIINYRTER